MIALAALLLLFPASQGAALGTSTTGTATATFLTVGAGARAPAMGDAYVSVADDATALYWNPAGLGDIQGHDITVTHSAYLGTSHFDYSAYGQSLGSYGGLGLGFQYFSAGTIDQTDAAATSLGGFSPYGLAVSGGYAYRFKGDSMPALSGYSVGAAVKYIESRIATTARTEAVDLGVRSAPYLHRNLRFAAAVSNLGRTMKFDQENENLPTEWRLGSSMNLTKAWLAAADLVLPRAGAAHVAIGTEAALFDGDGWTFAARGGFDSRTVGSVSGFAGPSFGFGCGYRRLSVDYAFVPLGSLGQDHRIALNYRF